MSPISPPNPHVQSQAIQAALAPRPPALAPSTRDTDGGAPDQPGASTASGSSARKLDITA